MPSAEIRAVVENRLGAERPGPFRWQPVSRGVGGSVWRVQAADTAWCVKTAADDPQMLLAEADGLCALAGCSAVRVPRVLAAEERCGGAFLLMEWLDLGHRVERAAARLGEQLTHQHQCFGKQFGWRRDNFIGATPQFNALSDDWAAFFCERRIGFQLRLAAENGHRGRLQTQGRRLVESLPAFFSGYAPKPSLLHGDLWGGNCGVTRDGEPVLFDPATYYGDRETDLAMTELFGGFGPSFHAAYRESYPVDPGYRVRRTLYNLYHILNHLNLFGSGYRGQAESMIDALIAELG